MILLAGLTRVERFRFGRHQKQPLRRYFKIVWVITIAIAAREGITSSKLRCFFLQNEAADPLEKAESER